jgi:hypothetical protein
VDSLRRRAFVGRQAELELFAHALEAAGPPPFTILHVHGPGGIGKSALLRMFGQRAAEAEAELFRIDGREVALEQDALRAVLAPARTAQRRPVLLVDTYELLAPLDGWLREELLPELPDDALVVLAGRRPPASGWMEDPGWRVISRVLPLAPLSAAESATYLADAPLVPAQRERVLRLAAGNPLVLTLARELAAYHEDVAAHLVEPAKATELVERLVDAAPTPAHREALQVCALARTTTEPLLREVLLRDDPAELVAWLRAQPYVETGPHGLYPHDVVREVLVAETTWREPQAAEALRVALRRRALRRCRNGDAADRERALLDVLFGFRYDPAAQAHYHWDTFGAVVAEPPRPGDQEGLRELLVQRAGEQGAAAILPWLDEQPGGVGLYRSGQLVQGAVLCLALQDAAPAVRAADPVAAAAWTWANDHGLRPDEAVVMVRLFVDRVADQRISAAHEIASARHLREVVTRPNLAFGFVVTTDPQYMAPLLAGIDYHPLPELDVVLGDQLFAMFWRDWRSGAAPPGWEGIRPAAAAELDEPDPAFTAAVRAALRDLDRPDRLAANPLLAAGVAEGGPALRSAVLAAVESLRWHPRDQKLYRALHHTYVRPAVTQERAAALLGLPFSTYRRHLAQGLERVTAALWASRK